MVKSNIILLEDKKVMHDLEITGSANEIILEISLILLRIKATNNKVFKDILDSIEIINNSIDDGVDVEELQDMYIKTYLSLLKKEGK